MSNNRILPFIVSGQGVFVFKNYKEEAIFSLTNNKNNYLYVKFTDKSISVFNGNTKETYIDIKNNKGLIQNKDAYYWFSLDSQNQILRGGIGEVRLETSTYEYKFNYKQGEEKYKINKKYLESLNYVVYDETIEATNLLKKPVVVNAPLKIKNTHELTMNDVAKNRYISHSILSPTAQKLYNCISGKSFVLNDDDFPDFSKAIEYSISTPGCWCHEKLKSKSREFNPNQPNIKETYLRITLGENMGNSPGIPYVLEIWPSEHYSPIHSHADTDAIIRVLHGEINVNLYPFLSSKKIDPFGVQVFEKDEVTWISPELNQIHQLINKNLGSTCITIQCYMYNEENRLHYDYFDYINEDGKIKKYEPDSDKGFVEFKELMKIEWLNRTK